MARFGETIEALRKQCRLTQTELAERADLGLSTIQKMEAMDEWKGNFRTYRKLAKGLGKTEEELDAILAGGTAPVVVTVAPPVAKRIREFYPDENPSEAVERLVAALLEEMAKVTAAERESEKPLILKVRNYFKRKSRS